jgi:gamma-glutamylcyclotransferase (GGCT)/AIG2-like uncharacterized protein YtfP
MDIPMPFSEAKVKDISTDTLRRILHRLHDKGVVSITSRGYFKRIEPFRELLFVYGSLKKGCDNHHLLAKYAKRIGKSITVGKFGMFEDSFGNYPYLVFMPLNRVHGELYEVKQKELMDKLDDFEGVPEFYQRKKILIKSHHGVEEAFVYIRLVSDIPKNQDSLKVWTDDSKHKLDILDRHLTDMIEA